MVPHISKADFGEKSWFLWMGEAVVLCGKHLTHTLGFKTLNEGWTGLGPRGLCAQSNWAIHPVILQGKVG